MTSDTLAEPQPISTPIKPSVTSPEMTEDSFEAISADGQLKKRVLKEGYGERPTKNSKVFVHYVGTLLNGDKFDSSRDRDELFEFKLGCGQVIKGWDEGVSTMRLGEKAELLCPPEYAYGERGSPPKIPANATLKFEVELFDFAEEADTIPKKIELATKGKEEGNAAFKSGDYKTAIAAYKKGLQYLEDSYQANDEEKKTIQELELSLNSNSAACYLKLNDGRAVISSCNKVLDADAKNVKALFRLAQAHILLGEFEEAKKTLIEAKDLAPEDAAIAREFQVLKQKEQQLKAKEKQLFGKLFQ